MRSLLQLRSANKYLDMSSIKEWLFIAPEHQIAKLIDFLEIQIGLLPCVPAAKVISSVLMCFTLLGSACTCRPSPSE